MDDMTRRGFGKMLAGLAGLLGGTAAAERARQRWGVTPVLGAIVTEPSRLVLSPLNDSASVTWRGHPPELRELVVVRHKGVTLTAGYAESVAFDRNGTVSARLFTGTDPAERFRVDPGNITEVVVEALPKSVHRLGI